MGVSEPYLPDEDINYPDIIDVAEGNIITKVKGYDLIAPGSVSRVYLESAIILECCILLCPSMGARLPKKQAGPHESHELYVNWDNKKIDFINERDSMIGDILEEEFPDLLPITILGFTVTNPKRGC